MAKKPNSRSPKAASKHKTPVKAPKQKTAEDQASRDQKIKEWRARGFGWLVKVTEVVSAANYEAVLQILSKLEPTKLLALQYTTEPFKGLLVSDRSELIWKISRERLHILHHKSSVFPGPPLFLLEREWAAAAFKEYLALPGYKWSSVVHAVKDGKGDWD